MALQVSQSLAARTSSPHSSFLLGSGEE